MYFADPRIVLLKNFQTIYQILTHFKCVLLQPFLFDHFKDSQTCGARNRVAAVGTEETVFISEFLGDFQACYHCSEWVPVAHWFSQGYDVGYHIIELKAPEMLAQASEASLDFICNAQPPFCMHIRE